VGLGTDIGAGTSLSQLATMNEAYKVQQLQGEQPVAVEELLPGDARRCPRPGPRGPHLGNFLPGKEADFLVLDLASTPLLRERLTHCKTLFETLFVLSTLGDDRAVRETWIMGERRHQRDTAPG
jgi:guanine deaminase